MSHFATVDRPTTRNPMLPPHQHQHQDPTMNPTAQAAAAAESAARTHSGAIASRQNRTREMQLIPKALASMDQRRRDVRSKRSGEARSPRGDLRLSAARRLQRRAERASIRARRALARAVMQ